MVCLILLLNMWKMVIIRGENMAFTSIMASDLKDKGVTGLPDTPQLTTEEMQRKFDELAKEVLVPAFNRLIKELGEESAASNIGISIPEGLGVDPNIAAIIAWLLSDSAVSDRMRHSHSNKAVLDLITATVKLGYDNLVNLFFSIAEVSDVVKNSERSLPTGKAIVDYISGLGGGDMLKSVYDANNSGVVDDSEKLGGEPPSFYQRVTDAALQTESKTIPGAINEDMEMAKNGGKNLIGYEFSTIKDYVAGNYAIKDNTLYRFVQDKAAGAWDETAVKATTVEEELSGLNAKMPNTKYVWDQSENITFPFTAHHDGIIELAIATTGALYSGGTAAVNGVNVSGIGCVTVGGAVSQYNTVFVCKGDIISASPNPAGGSVTGKFYWTES